MWAAAKVCHVSLRPVVKQALPVLRNPLTVSSQFTKTGTNHQIVRQFTREKTHVLRRALKKQESLGAFTVGRSVLIGSGVAGLGALCYYGLGLSKEAGILEHSTYWPEYVRERVRTTYMYVGGSIAVAVATASVTLGSPAVMRIFTSGRILPNLLLFGGVIASSFIVQSIPYEPGFGPKQLAWLGFSSLIGATMAPLAFYGGPVLIRAAWYTAGIVGSLSAVAVCAPNEKFLQMGGALAIGSGLLLASGLGAMFLPPTTAVGAGLHSIFLYGGLIFFSAMLMYNVQRIAHTASSMPPDHFSSRKYDPVNMSLSVFMDIVNIFMRLVVLSGGSNRKH